MHSRSARTFRHCLQKRFISVYSRIKPCCVASCATGKWLSLKRGTGNRGTGMGEREWGTGNGESLKRGVLKSGNL